MAERRMFSKKITDSDAFIELSSAAQALYFHLNQAADDDGFNNQVQMAMYKAHAGIDDLKILLAKNFIIRFESGVIVIKHWRIHNTLRKDRYNPTNFQEELKSLGIKENGAYTLNKDGCQVVAKWLPQNSIDKNSIDKVNNKKGQEEKKHLAEFVSMTNAEYEKLVNTYGKKFADQCVFVLDNYKGSSGKKYKSDYRAILNWVIKRVKEDGFKPQEEIKEFKEIDTRNMSSEEYRNMLLGGKNK